MWRVQFVTEKLGYRIIIVASDDEVRLNTKNKNKKIINKATCNIKSKILGARKPNFYHFLTENEKSLFYK